MLLAQADEEPSTPSVTTADTDPLGSFNRSDGAREFVNELIAVSSEARSNT